MWQRMREFPQLCIEPGIRTEAWAIQMPDGYPIGGIHSVAIHARARTICIKDIEMAAAWCPLFGQKAGETLNGENQ